MVLGIVGLWALMAKDGQWPLGAWYGVGCVLVAAYGLLTRWFGLHDNDPNQNARVLTTQDLWNRVRVSRATWVVLFAGLLYVPRLGSFGLWDPWETHYGEVAREILSRDDWISLWWAHEHWFWSKPILIFWLEALSMNMLGVDFHPGSPLRGVDWALRLPHVALSIGALLAVYGAVKTVWNRNTALVVAWVLATTPMFFFLSHQAITDMPYVATMTIALCFLVLALHTDPERLATTYRFRRWTLSAPQLVAAVLFCITLPQIVYLLSRNVKVPWHHGQLNLARLWQDDRFLMGSAGNAGVPGNPPLTWMFPRFDGPAAQPAFQALVWAALATGLLWHLRQRRTLQALYMTCFYMGCALSFMAKGIPGVALPGLVALLYLISSRRWELLLSGQLRVASGIATVGVIGMPWFVAMYNRHGRAFTDRLLIHDHLNRLSVGVHGDTGAIQYFLLQLGIGTFPWLFFIPWAMYWAARSEARSLTPPGPNTRTFDSRHETIRLLVFWFLGTFTLFSAMVTKFHHYIFPSVPPLAILIGLSAAAWFARSESGSQFPTTDARSDTHPDTHIKTRAIATARALAGVAGVVLLLFVGRDLCWKTGARPAGYERLIQLFVYNYERPWPAQFDYRTALTGFVSVAVVLGSLLTVASALSTRPSALGAYLTLKRGWLLLSAGFTLWCLHVYLVDLSPHWSQRELVYRYYRLRNGPNEPLLAWQMNWKGENLYTGNRVYTFVEVNHKDIRTWADQHRGTPFYVLLEHGRLNNLKRALSGYVLSAQSTVRDQNKFLLVRASAPHR